MPLGMERLPCIGGNVRRVYSPGHLRLRRIDHPLFRFAVKRGKYMGQQLQLPSFPRSGREGRQAQRRRGE
jgi:hypothetical protein